MKYVAAALMLVACGTDNYRFEDYWYFVDSDTTVRPNLHDRLFEAFDDSGTRIAASMGKDGDVGLVEFDVAPPFLLHETEGTRDRWESVIYDVGVEQDQLAGRSDAALATSDHLVYSFDGYVGAPFERTQFECFGTGNGFDGEVLTTNYGAPHAHVCDPARGDRFIGYHQTGDDGYTMQLSQIAEMSPGPFSGFVGTFAPVVPATPATIAIDVNSFPAAHPLELNVRVWAGPDLVKNV